MDYCYEFQIKGFIIFISPLFEMVVFYKRYTKIRSYWNDLFENIL